VVKARWQHGCAWWGPRSGSLAEKQEKKEHEGHEEDDVWSRD
jgi:hypothetical protein